MSLAWFAICATGVLRRDQTEVRHQRPWMRKAREIADFGDEGDRGKEAEAFQAHQPLDQGIHAPGLAQLAQSLGYMLNAFAGLFAGLPILVERDLLGRMLEADRGEVPLVCLAPGSVMDIVATVTQEHRLHLLTDSQARCHRIFSGTRQVPHGLVPLIRNEDRGKAPCAGLASEHQRVTTVGLDALLAGTTADARGGDNFAPPLLLAQVPHPAIPARPGLVHQQAGLRAATLPPQCLAQLRRKRIDGSDKPRCCATRLCDRNGDGAFPGSGHDV